MYTLDTNAIIYYLKDDPAAVSFFDAVLRGTAPLYVSTITEVELFGFESLNFAEYEAINHLLNTVTILPLDSRVARIAGSLRRNYGMKVPDSIIAATALVTHTALVTRNVKDFKKIADITIHTL